MERVWGVAWRAGVLAVLMTPLVIVPLGVLVVGIVTFGADLGWWVGEPTWNDGEGTWGLAIGATLTLIVLALGGALALALTRRRRRDLPWVVVVACVLPVVMWVAFNASRG